MKLYAKDTARRSSVRKSATNLADNLAGLARAWNAFGYGEFTMQHLGDAMNAEPRTVPTAGTDGCRSCAGMLQFSSGQTFLEEFLLDQPGQVTAGGVKLSRHRLRDLIELPDAPLIEDFDRHLRWVRNAQDFLPFVSFDEATQTATILEAAVEQEGARHDLYLKPDKEALYEQVTKFITVYNTMLTDLTKRPDRPPFTLELPSTTLYGPNAFKKDSTGRLSLDESWIRLHLCRPIPSA